MSHPHLKTPLAEFSARVQRTKNRLVAIPAAAQRKLGLGRRRDNHIILASLRSRGRGRWNHHYFKLTSDNEFAIPADVTRIGPGDEVDVRVRRIVSDVPALCVTASAGAGLLVALAERPRPGWRKDGATHLDEYLNDEIA